MSQKKTFNRYIYLSFIIMIVAVKTVFAANVGVVDTRGKYSDLDKICQIVKALGHRVEVVPVKNLTRPTGLTHLDCVILSHRNGQLNKSSYLALAEYTRDGGTLLLTGLAAYWMKTPKGKRKQRRIAGEGPLKNITGTKIMAAREGIITLFTVGRNNQLTKGLPKQFKPQTNPPYDINNSHSWRNAGCYLLKAVKSMPLITVKAYFGHYDRKSRKMIYKLKEEKSGDFLTINKIGRGRCIRMGCRLTPLILQKTEKHITRILSNIITSSEKYGI